MTNQKEQIREALEAVKSLERISEAIWTSNPSLRPYGEAATLPLLETIRKYIGDKG